MCKSISLSSLVNTQYLKALQPVLQKRVENNSFVNYNKSTMQFNISELALAIKEAQVNTNNKVEAQVQQKENLIPSELDVRKAFYKGDLDPRKVGEIHKKYENGELHIYVDKKNGKICICYRKDARIILKGGQMITEDGSTYMNSHSPKKYEQLVEDYNKGIKSVLWE